ncbi:MAG: undecaprenyl-phosphate galactose phosphotransferase WbaP [Acidobacteriota bacterium]|nr:undecaprenyl-phosphate galactose phosphotransferase WbaP [Acidobacteriota bacterium]
MTPAIVDSKRLLHRGTSLVPTKPWFTTVCFVLTDLMALLLAVSLGLFAKFLVEHQLDLGSYLRLWPFLIVFLLVYAALGLYSEASLSPPDELKRSTISSSVIFVALASTTVPFRGATQHITWTLLLIIFFSLMFLPLFRSLLRQNCSRRDWWGFSAVVFGGGSRSEAIIRALVEEPENGLKPVAVIDPETSRRKIGGVPVLQASQLACELIGANRLTYAVVTVPGAEGDRMVRDFERFGFNFSHVIYLTEQAELSSLWVRPRSVGGLLGMEVRRSFLLQESLFAKRILDLTLTLIGGVVVLPILLLIALAIRLDSPGPVLFRHRRIGRGGRNFFAWKYRTMAEDADRVLERCLESDPEARAEWERDQKLKNDPRVTRVGRFLRKASLDELPQIWNVIKGEMSLVGPRPIVEREVEKYGRGFDIYTRVASGVTGLWQVSGRNDTTYEERIRLDCFYVNNWSVWLDLCILFRTIGTVLLRKGAY